MAGDSQIIRRSHRRATSSWRKDDSRLHVDAFPSRPNLGEHILRIFTNINPHGEHHQWRIGESFPQLARRFMLEQTFLLPVDAMKNPQQSPLKVLETLLQHPLL
ncbi:Protein of uncharacterised function (DUF2843) [Serratia proteamaculans]|nr:Protein of uncharacterised function (DUF2843) [Serratia proteamaculans]